MALSGSLLDLRRAGGVCVAAAPTRGAESRARPGSAGAFLEAAERHEDCTVPAARARLTRIAAMERTTTPGPIPIPVEASGLARAIVDTQRVSHASMSVTRLEDFEAALRSATSPGERARARLALGRGRLEQGDARAGEPLLWEALADGLVEAGDVLAPLLTSTERLHDLVRVRRQQVALEPGDVPRLEALRTAILGDGDRVYARAVEHVVRAFDPAAGPLPPPPLSGQPEQPGVFAMLARPAMDAAGEALALLWEGAAQLFVRDAASYGISGVERIVPGGSSNLARLYEAAMRTLDCPRNPLFVPRAGTGTPVSHVALLAPASVNLAGDVREETLDLRFALGRGMSAALPQNVLRLGLTPADCRALIDALRAALGPTQVDRSLDTRSARWAESFWQVVPARAQRRLQELLGTTVLPEYEELVARPPERASHGDVPGGRLRPRGPCASRGRFVARG